MALLSIPSRIGFAWLGEFYTTKQVFMLTLVLQMLGLAILAVAGTSVVPVFVAMGMYGLGVGGSVPLRPALVGDFFGRASFATIQGWMGAFGPIGNLAGPPLAGWIYDRTGRYVWAFGGWAISTSLAVLVLHQAKAPEPKPSAENAPPADASVRKAPSIGGS
jgi:OFA family oxalate/formate antiporter-like MFS transporter